MNDEKEATGFDPSTWAKQPRLLARNDADAALVRYIVMAFAGRVCGAGHSFGYPLFAV